MRRVEDFFCPVSQEICCISLTEIFFKGRLRLHFINDVCIVLFDKHYLYLCNIINLSRYVSKWYYDNINTIEKRKNIWYKTLVIASFFHVLKNLSVRVILSLKKEIVDFYVLITFIFDKKEPQTCKFLLIAEKLRSKLWRHGEES